MENLLLLFTKDGLQWQINKASTTIEEEAFFVNEEENNPTFIEKKLEDVLQSKYWNEICFQSFLINARRIFYT